MHYFQKYGVGILLAGAIWLFIAVALTHLTTSFSNSIWPIFTTTTAILIFISYLIYVDRGGGMQLNKLKSVFPIVNLTFFILSIVFIVLYIVGFVTTMTSVSECPRGAVRPGFTTGFECGDIFGFLLFPLFIALSLPTFFITGFLLWQEKKYKQQERKE